MFSSLMDMKDGEQLLPFARMFHGDPATHLREDQVGEQGDALMPMLFRLGER